MKTINTVLLSLSFVFSMSLNFSYGQEGYVPIEDVKKAAMYYANQKWGDVEIYDSMPCYEIGSDSILAYSFSVWKGVGSKPLIKDLKLELQNSYDARNVINEEITTAQLNNDKSKIVILKNELNKTDKLRLKADTFGTVVIGATFNCPVLIERRNGLSSYLIEEPVVLARAKKIFDRNFVFKRLYYLGPATYGYEVIDSENKAFFYSNYFEINDFNNAFIKHKEYPERIYDEKLSESFLYGDWLKIERNENLLGDEISSSIIPGVPHYRQDDYGTNTCSPTATAQVLGYWDDNGYNNLIDCGSSNRVSNSAGVSVLVDNLKSAMGWNPNQGTLQLNIAPGLETVTNTAQYHNNLNFNADFDILALWSTVIVPSVDANRPFVFSIQEEVEMIYPIQGTFNADHSMTGVGYRIDPNMRVLIVHINDGVFWDEDVEINYETVNNASTVEVFPNGSDNILPTCQITYPNNGETQNTAFPCRATFSDLSGIWQVHFQYSTDHIIWNDLPGETIYNLLANATYSDVALVFFPDQAGILYDKSVWVRARSRDNWGNWSSWDECNQPFTVDLRGPQPTSINVSATLNPTSVQQNDPVTVSGTAIYNTGNPVTSGTVLIEIAGINTWTTYLNSSGNFSTIINAPSSTGNYTVKVTVADGTISNFVNKSLSVTGGSSGSGYTYNRSTICENVNPNSPYAPINETHWIRADEVYVFCWTELDNIASGKNLRVKWNWYRPDGSSLGSIESDYTGNGPCDWYRMWGGWTVQGTTLANTEGKWTVKIYVKEYGGSYIYRETQYFTVRYNLTEHRMAEDVGPDPYPTINPKNIFYQTDSKALTWMNLDDVSDGQEIKWEFHEPNGNMYGTGATYSVPDPGQGTYYPWYRLWGWIDINNNQAADKTGNWYVDVFIKNAFNSWELKYTDNFTIKENPNVNPVETIGNPSTVMEGQTITISVSVSDNAYLKKVIFYWNDGTDHNVVLADNINSSSYNGNASIGPFVENKQISCYVLAIDNSVNQATSLQKEFTIEDTDITGPTISNFSILEYNGNGNGQIDPNEQVNISWNLSDPSGIGSVVLIVDSTSQTIVNTTHSICGPFSEGSHSVVLFASDNDISPMSSSYYYSFNVSQQAFSLGGFVSYDNSAVTGLNDVNVNLIQNGNIVSSAITNLSGAYTFNNVVNGSYTINSSSTKLWGGVNSTDALQIRRHIAGISLLSGLRLFAADVNVSSTITSTDALLIRRRVAGLDPTFASGDWLFENPAFSVSGQNVIQNFKGLCFGDVNGSYVPSMMVGKESFVNSSGNSEIYLKNNEVLSVPIKTLSPLNISALTLIIKYPSESIEIESVNSKLEGLLYNIQDEEIRIAWDDLSSVNFKPEEAIIILSVKNKNQTLKEGEITFTLDANSELADVQANVIKDVQLDIPRVKVNFPEDFSLLDCFPNPFNPSTTIEYKLPENAVVRIEIVNIIGERVGLIIEGTQEAGTHRLQWDASELPSGVYVYRLEAIGEKNSFSKVKKMLLIK